MLDLVRLPADLIRHICLQLDDFATLARVRAVCTALRAVASEPRLWRLLVLHQMRACCWAIHERQLESVSPAAAAALLCGLSGRWTPPRLVSHAHGDSFEVSADGLCIALARDCHLGTNRALRFEPALPMKPHLALRAEHCAFEVASHATAYFEVAIGQPDPSRGFGVRDCIAIGLASARFPLEGRQPGWDVESFGIHSDDGRLFHGSGACLRSPAHRFGPGDVVGCGLSLVSRRIFFTLNGQLLDGPALVARRELTPLHAVVGLDSHAPIALNFGSRSFAFDLRNLPQVAHENVPSASRLRSAIGSIVGSAGCFIALPRRRKAPPMPELLTPI